MRNPVAIENIEDIRLQEGIDDVELRNGIRRLRIGDLVKLTFLKETEPGAGETLLVRITSISGCTFRGKLDDKPAASWLSNLPAGSSVAFTTAHIHSLAKRQPPHGQ